MKQLSVAALTLIAMLLLACDLLSSQVSKPQPIPVQAVSPAQLPTATLPLPAATCQSRLGGKVTQNATKQSRPGATVEISGAGKTFQTQTDANGSMALPACVAVSMSCR